MKSKAARVAVGCAAALVRLRGWRRRTLVAGRAEEAHLEAHGKVIIWGLTPLDTGEVLSTREEHINVDAEGTLPLPDCGRARLRRPSSAFRGQRRLSVPQESSQGPPPCLAVWHEPRLRRRRGAGSASPSAQENAAGVTPTTDYIAYFNLSPAFVLRAYFQAGGIQLIGG